MDAAETFVIHSLDLARRCAAWMEEAHGASGDGPEDEHGTFVTTSPKLRAEVANAAADVAAFLEGWAAELAGEMETPLEGVGSGEEAAFAKAQADAGRLVLLVVVRKLVEAATAAEACAEVELDFEMAAAGWENSAVAAYEEAQNVSQWAGTAAEALRAAQGPLPHTVLAPYEQALARAQEGWGHLARFAFFRSLEGFRRSVAAWEAAGSGATGPGRVMA